MKLATREILSKSTRKGGLGYIYQGINYSIKYQFSQGIDGKKAPGPAYLRGFGSLPETDDITAREQALPKTAGYLVESDKSARLGKRE